MKPPVNDRAPLEDLTFHGSPGPTLGIELELQVLDRETGDLAPGGSRILEACHEEGMPDVSGEFLQSMLEIKTNVCGNVREAEQSLAPRLKRLRNLARSLGYDLAWGGSHPVDRPSMSALSAGSRYERIQKQHGWMAFHEVVFGLHVHVGVPNERAAIGAINALVRYLPHLAALAANSPFWQGVDTGCASARLRMFRPSARSGVPPQFADWDEFCQFCEIMHGAGAIEGTKDIYWDIRPRPATGTIEIRICDTPSTLETALAVAALARALVTEAVVKLDQSSSGAAPRGAQWLAAENRWKASRYGLKAECVLEPREAPVVLGEDVVVLCQRLAPVIEKLGDGEYLASFERADRLETGADRQRRIFRDTGDWQAVLADMKERWVADLETRQLQPAEAASP